MRPCLIKSSIMKRALSETSTRNINCIIILLCILSLLSMCILCIYDRPSADDFAYSYLTRDAFQSSSGNPFTVLKAAVDTSVLYYHTWQGLYTSAFLLALQPGIADSVLYGIGPFIIILFIIAACLFMVYCAERHLFRSKTCFWPSGGFLFATALLICMPSATEGIYWYNGAANYTPLYFACFFSIGLCLISLNHAQKTKSTIAAIVAALLCLIISGGNYMPAFFNVLLMIGFAFFGIKKKRFILIAPAITSLAGFAISMLAPGTAIRQAALTDLFGKPSIPGTLIHSTHQALMDMRMFFDLPTLIVLAALTPLFIIWIRSTTHDFSLKKGILIALAGFMIMVGVLCVPYYAGAGFGEGRCRNIAYFVDMTMLVILYIYVLGIVISKHKTPARSDLVQKSENASAENPTGLSRFTLSLPALVVGALVVLLALSLYGSQAVGHGNNIVALKELVTKEAQTYAAEYDAREKIMLDNRGGNATITPLKTRPFLLFYSDVVRKEDDWTGRLKEYYHLNDLHFVQQDNDSSSNKT